MQTRRCVHFMLSMGAVAGILLAAAGALVPTRNDFSGNVLARVNGKAITAQEVNFALARLGGDGAVTREKRLETVQRLIDQELLIQRASEIGLLDSDRTVRKAIAMAVVDTIVANTLAKEPTEAELVSFYESHQAVFTTPAQVRVQQISFSGNGALGKALAQAEKASAAISHGMDFTEARERYGDGNSVPVPDTPLPLPVLQRQLGPLLTSRIQTMKAGDISPPLQSPSGYLIVRLVEWQPEQIRPYQTVSQEVKAEYLRRKRDEALQHYLDSLRQEATVVLSPKAPG